MNNFRMDSKAEKELGKFLNKYLYNRLMDNDIKYIVQEVNSTKDKIINGYKRIEDKINQSKGIDVIIYNNKTYKIDEKAALYYINRNLPTFAFELSYLNNKKEVIKGWFLNDNLETDFYLLIWIEAETKNLIKITENDFTVLDCLLIRKKTIRNFLNSYGFSEKGLSEKASQIRNSGVVGAIDSQNTEDFYFYMSSANKYPEEPINVIIKKKRLINLAVSHYKVSKKELIKIEDIKSENHEFETYIQVASSVEDEL